jgi:hypothetical protein
VFQWSCGALLRKLFKEFGDLVRNVARDDLVRVLVVRSANVAWWHSDVTGIIGNKGNHPQMGWESETSGVALI